jgi:hypothetical protein
LRQVSSASHGANLPSPQIAERVIACSQLKELHMSSMVLSSWA